MGPLYIPNPNDGMTMPGAGAPQVQQPPQIPMQSQMQSPVQPPQQPPRVMGAQMPQMPPPQPGMLQQPSQQRGPIGKPPMNPLLLLAHLGASALVGGLFGQHASQFVNNRIPPWKRRIIASLNPGGAIGGNASTDDDPMSSPASSADDDDGE